MGRVKQLRSVYFKILLNYRRKAGQQSTKILSAIGGFRTATCSCPCASPEVHPQLTAVDRQECTVVLDRRHFRCLPAWLLTSPCFRANEHFLEGPWVGRVCPTRTQSTSSARKSPSNRNCCCPRSLAPDTSVAIDWSRFLLMMASAIWHPKQGVFGPASNLPSWMGPISMNLMTADLMDLSRRESHLLSG